MEDYKNTVKSPQKVGNEMNKTYKAVLGLALALVLGFGESPPAPAKAQAADQTAKPRTLFTNVNVFDGKNEKLIRNASVLVEGNLITQVTTS